VLNAAFDLSSLKEFTVELNPGRIQANLLSQFKQSGVDRLSIGVQSFHDQELQTLGRIHSVEDIWQVGELVRQVGFKHLNADLIYGIPGQTLTSWKSSLEQLLLLPVDHVSLYNLSYERGTLLDEWHQKRVIMSLDPELEWQMYGMAHNFLRAAGFRHYEISNWAKPGSESRHNCGYWSGRNYLGLGPAAHSFFNRQRWWNYRSVEKYLKALSGSNFPEAGREQLTNEDREIEYIFLGLRMAQGLSVRKFNNLFLIDFKRLVERLADKIGSDEYWIFAGDSYKLTLRGWFVCDSITHQMLQLIEEIKHGH
jgi:oxygen-independent coproporphyrinogen-3 oxidase